MYTPTCALKRKEDKRTRTKEKRQGKQHLTIVRRRRTRMKKMILGNLNVLGDGGESVKTRCAKGCKEIG
jgi:hypothetical protein